jgi:hypothetical protein
MRNDRPEVVSWRAAGVPGDQQSRLTAARSLPIRRGAEGPPMRVGALWLRQDDQDDAHHWLRNQVEAATAAFPAQMAVLGTC